MNWARAALVTVAMAAGLLTLSACASPPLTPGQQATSPSQTVAPAQHAAVSYSPPATAPVDQTPAGTPSVLPYVTPSDGAAAVLMDDTGSGLVIFGMTPDQFHQQAAKLGWTCTPATGADDAGFVYTPHAVFRFFNGTLSNVTVADTSFQTQRGFEVGDTVAQLTQMYGTGYVLSDLSGTSTYTYTMSSGVVFWAFVNDGETTVNAWALSAPGSGPS